VRQGADAGQADGKVPVVGVGKADPGGFDEQTQTLWISPLNARWGLKWLAENSLRLGSRQNGFVGQSVWEPHAALIPLPKPAHRFQHDRNSEMPRQRNLSAKRENLGVVAHPRVRIGGLGNLRPECPPLGHRNGCHTNAAILTC
jgi:hypothetical protein